MREEFWITIRAQMMSNGYASGVAQTAAHTSGKQANRGLEHSEE
jgi:hypothetical protein